MNTALLAPLKRDRQWDFACVTGTAIYDAQVRHVLLTQSDSHHGAGELPWRTEFGTPLNTVRHASLDAGTIALIRNHIRVAFDRWLPHLALRWVAVEPLDNVMRATVAYVAHTTGTSEHRTVIDTGGSAR